MPSIVADRAMIPAGPQKVGNVIYWLEQGSVTPEVAARLLSELAPVIPSNKHDFLTSIDRAIRSQLSWNSVVNAHFWGLIPDEVFSMAVEFKKVTPIHT